jgi:hypothetical protein
MAATKRATTFRLDDHLLDGLQQVKERRGIDLTEQVTRAIGMWLEAMGVSVRVAGGGAVTKRLVERVSGRGRVLSEKATPISEGQYDLSVWQDIHRVSTLGGVSTLDGLREIQGSIDLPSQSIRANMGKSLVLELEDGRKLPFFFTHSSGTIAARGNLQ